MAIEQGRRIVLPERGGTDSEDEDEDGDGGSASEEDKGKPPPAAGSPSQANGRPHGGAVGKDPAVPVTTAGKLALLARQTMGDRGSKKRSNTTPTPSYLPGPRLEATPPSPLIYTPTKAPPSSGTFFPPSPLSSPSVSQQSHPRNGKSTNASSPIINSIPRRRMPGGKSSPTSPSHPATSLSVPSLPLSRSASYLLTSQPNPPSNLPKSFLSHLLLLQSSRTQLDLLRSLQDISTRLVSVPKPARLSSLRAELTVLNHGLPRGCCLGMACHGTPFPVLGVPGSKGKAHARIVRISPSESVVLNSADRAPFVIHVEVLEDDLDFDPERRQNAEDLRRALSEREGTSGGYGGGFGKEGLGAKARMSLESGLDGLGRSGGAEAKSMTRVVVSTSSSDLGAVLPAAADGDAHEVLTSPELPKEPTEEMDLVEQLYGDVSIHDDADLLIAPVEGDVAIQNRSVDEQAWARRADDDAGRQSHESDATLTPATALNPPRPTFGRGRPSGGANFVRPGGRSVSDRPVVSLDDYAERMRMAAIMLAQLDASQAASLGVVATGTAAAGTLVGLPVATVAGIGGVVGAGLGAVANRLVGRRDVQAGQASTGVAAALDTSSAVEGTSSVAGAPPRQSMSVGPTSVGNPNPASLLSQRQRVLAPVEAAAIRNRIMGEMLALEEERMERMREDGRARSGWSGSSGMEDGAVVMRAVNKDDPSGEYSLLVSLALYRARLRLACRRRLPRVVRVQEGADSVGVAVRPPSELERHLRHRQDWCRPTAGATRRATHQGLRPDLEGGGVSVVGSLVSSFLPN